MVLPLTNVSEIALGYWAVAVNQDGVIPLVGGFKPLPKSKGVSQVVNVANALLCGLRTQGGQGVETGDSIVCWGWETPFQRFPVTGTRLFALGRELCVE